MDYIALAIAPGLAISLFIFHRDAYNREPKITLIVSFLLGVVSIIPAFFIEKALSANMGISMAEQAVKAILIVALTEECCKFAVLRFYAYTRKSFDEPFDGIVYSVMASMGFATLENILYVMSSAEAGNGYQVAFLRMFLSVPAHASFAVLMGYHAGQAKFNRNKEVWLLLLGIFWAVLFHGAYDLFLFWQQSPEIKPFVSDMALFLGAVVSFIVALRLSFKHIAKHRQLSQRTFMPGAKLTLRPAMKSDIPLITQLSHKIWPATYASILSNDQIEYMLELMYSEHSLLEQMHQRHEFIIVNDGPDPVGYASFSLHDQGVFKLHKLYLLPGMQKKGVGRFVLNQLENAIARKGGRSLQLNVNRENPAREFYEKLGFQILRQEDIEIGRGYYMNDYVMEKIISPGPA